MEKEMKRRADGKKRASRSKKPTMTSGVVKRTVQQHRASATATATSHAATTPEPLVNTMRPPPPTAAASARAKPPTPKSAAAKPAAAAKPVLRVVQRNSSSSSLTDRALSLARFQLSRASSASCSASASASGSGSGSGDGASTSQRPSTPAPPKLSRDVSDDPLVQLRRMYTSGDTETPEGKLLRRRVLSGGLVIPVEGARPGDAPIYNDLQLVNSTRFDDIRARALASLPDVGAIYARLCVDPLSWREILASCLVSLNASSSDSVIKQVVSPSGIRVTRFDDCIAVDPVAQPIVSNARSKHLGLAFAVATGMVVLKRKFCKLRPKSLLDRMLVYIRVPPVFFACASTSPVDIIRCRVVSKLRSHFAVPLFHRYCSPKDLALLCGVSRVYRTTFSHVSRRILDHLSSRVLLPSSQLALCQLNRLCAARFWSCKLGQTVASFLDADVGGDHDHDGDDVARAVSQAVYGSRYVPRHDEVERLVSFFLFQGSPSSLLRRESVITPKAASRFLALACNHKPSWNTVSCKVDVCVDPWTADRSTVSPRHPFPFDITFVMSDRSEPTAFVVCLDSLTCTYWWHASFGSEPSVLERTLSQFLRPLADRSVAFELSLVNYFKAKPAF